MTKQDTPLLETICDSTHRGQDKMIETRIRRQRVRFSEFSTLVLMEPKTRENLDATWYSRQEIAEFKMNARLDLHIAREIYKLRRANVENIEMAKRRRHLTISDQIVDEMNSQDIAKVG